MTCGRAAAALSLFLFLSPGWSAGGLSGVYRLWDMSKTGGQSNVTVEIRISNANQFDLVNAAIILVDPVRPISYGVIRGITLRSGSSVQVVQRFTISKDEAERWEAGNPPLMMANYMDEEQNLKSVAVTLKPWRRDQ